MMQLLRNKEEKDDDDEIDLPRFSFKTNAAAAAPRPSFVTESLSRMSFSYNKLPQEPLTLTVLKLDGSSFVIVVPKMGTVVHLKQGIEEAFSHLPKRGPGMVSWSHVWGHFCLSFDGQRLLTDDDCIGDYGIRDGDTLRFVRRVSVAACNVVVKEELEQTPSFNGHAMNLSSSVAVISRMEGCKDIVSSCKEGITHRVRIVETDQDDDNKVEDKGIVRYCRYKLAYMVRSWFTHQRLTTSLDVRTKPSRLYPTGYAKFQESGTTIY